MKRPHIPTWMGDILVGLVVIGLLATAVFSAWQFHKGLATSCIRSRYGNNCLPGEPWGYGFLMLVAALSGLMALGCAAFVTRLRIHERP